MFMIPTKALYNSRVGWAGKFSIKKRPTLAASRTQGAEHRMKTLLVLDTKRFVSLRLQTNICVWQTSTSDKSTYIFVCRSLRVQKPVDRLLELLMTINML